jgi:hypothetical protein
VLGVVDVVEVGVVALLVVARIVLFDELAVVDDSSPCTGFDLLHLDEGLEAGKVGSHRTLHVAHSACRLLDQRARLHVERDLNPGEAIRDLVEGDDARMRDALAHVPHDPLVRALLDDLGLELLRHPPDLRLEGDGAIVLLRRLIEAMHELRPFLELGPLVVGGAYGHGHFDALLDR